MRGLLVASSLRIADVAEAFAAEDGSGLDDDAIADMDCRIDGDVGVDAAVGSDGYIVADDRAGADGGFIFDSYVFPDYSAGADGYVVGNPGGFRDHGGRMDRASFLGTAEELGCAGEGEARVRGDQERLRFCGGEVGGGEISSDDGGRWGLESGVEMLGVFHEDEAVRCGGLQA